MGILGKWFCLCDLRQTRSSATWNQSSTQIEELCIRFSLAQIRKATNNFDERLIIGRADTGYVYKGRMKCASDYSIAIKRGQRSNLKHASAFKNESELLCQLRHPNLVSLIGFCNDKNENILVYEYLPNGSLYEYLHLGKKYINMQPLSWKKRLEICIGAARGLHYLHAGAKYSIFHGDIKSCNIILDKNWVPKLADLGLSLKGPKSTSKSMAKPKRRPPPYLTKTLDTSGYRAPEYFMSNSVTDKCDVYSFGVVLMEVVCAKRPRDIILATSTCSKEDEHDMAEDGSTCSHEHSSKGPVTKLRSFVEGGNADKIIDPFLKGKIAPACWELFIDIAQRCTLLEPTERPTMGEVEAELEHALALQQEADARHNGDYSSLSTASSAEPQEAKFSIEQ